MRENEVQDGTIIGQERMSMTGQKIHGLRSGSKQELWFEMPDFMF